MVLRNVRILPEHYTAPQPRGPRPEFSPPQKPQMSQTVHCQNISYARWLLPTWYCYWTATLSTLSSHPVDQCCFFKLLLYTHTHKIHTRCDYEVAGMILLQASYLCIHSLLRRVTLQGLPLSGYALSSKKHFWNSCCGIASSVIVTFFRRVQYPKIFVPLRQTLFLETGVIRSQIEGVGWVFHFSNRFLGHKLHDRERLVNWSIVMAEKPLFGQTSSLFLCTASLNGDNIST